MSEYLAATTPIPTVLTNARVYLEGASQLGLATVELPSFEYMTEDVSGLGIGGELSMPVKGHFKSMSLKLTWNTVTTDLLALMSPEGHHLDIRGNLQDLDAATHQFVDRAVKIVVRGMPKTIGLGKMEAGKKMEPETEFECEYIKIWIGGNERVEVDKLNMFCFVNGTDVLSSVRNNLGM